MNEQEFENTANAFTEDMKNLLNAALLGELTVKSFTLTAESFLCSFVFEKQLFIGTSGSDRLQLIVEFQMCSNSTGEQLAVKKSSFKVNFRALKKYVPIVRFEYDRDARNKPASHVQFHGDSVPLGLLLARAGKYDLAAQQHNVHLPAGGKHYRACLEDIIEFLIEELDAQAHPQWHEHVEGGRGKFHTTQAEAVIRHNLDHAIAMLKEQGYTVERP